MYSFVSLERIISFFNKFNIDITLFNDFETSLIIILCNIFVLLFYLFIFYVVYKIIFKILSWWF